MVLAMPGHTLWLRMPAAVICLVSAVVIFLQVRRANLRHWRITVDGNGRFHCQLPQTQRTITDFQCELDVKTVIWPTALFLNLRRLDNDNMINLVILSDALDGDEFRQLSIACRWMMTRSTSKAAPDL